MKKYFNISLCFIALAMVACNDNSDGVKKDTTTSGNITITVDESLKPLIEAEIMVFEAMYPKATITANYVSEAEAIRLMVNDSARLAIVTRKLTPEETAVLKSQQHKGRYTDIAFDGVTLIMHKDNPDTIFTINQVREILSGNTGDWSKINGSSKLGKINVVFDNAQSGAVRYLRDSLLGGRPLGKNCFAVNTNPDVISYVEKNPNSIGVIGCSWISDKDDSTSMSFLKTVNIASLIPNDVENAEAATMKPYQAYIALKQYPFWRPVMIISREARSGLGTGFASFVASDQGQRIILKAGIVPANAPVRIIHSK